MTFVVAKHFFEKKVGIIAGLLAAIYAPFLFFEGIYLGTSVVTFFLMASLFCLVHTGTKWSSHLLAFASCLFLALAITGRPNLLLLAPIPLLFFLLNKKNFGKISFVYILIAVSGLAIPIGLTGLHNYLAGGQFIILTTHGGINFYIGNHENASGTWEAPEGIEASVSAINLVESKRFAEVATGKELTASQVSRFWYNKAFSFILGHPFQWGGLIVKKLLLFWSGYEVPVNYDYHFYQRYSSLLRLPFINSMFYMPFAILGIIIFAPEWRKYWVLYALIGTACLSVVIFYIGHRYRIVVMPIIIIISSAGLVALFDFMREKGLKRWFTLVSLLLLFAIQIGYTQNRISKISYANDYYNISTAYLTKENLESSIYWGQHAVAEDPTYVNAHYNIGIAYLKLKQYDKALVVFSTVIKIDPTEAGAQRNVGGLLLMRREYSKALHHLEKSLEYEPGNIITLMNLGLAHYYLWEYKKAIDAWQLLLDIDSQNEQARNNINDAKRFL